MSIRFLAVSTLSCLLLAVGCADVDPSSDDATASSAQEQVACRANAEKATSVARDLRAAVATEADDGAQGAPASPEITSAGTVKAIEREGEALVKLPVPKSICTTPSRPDQGITVFTAKDQSFSTAVMANSEGAFRALVHIASKDAPSAYRFDLKLPEGGELLPLEDGGVVVRNAAGDMVASFPPAWAKDANGLPVPTHYEIDGATLIQVIDFAGQSITFPVVADPFWIPILAVFAHLTRHALTQMAARGVSQALVRQVVLNGRRTAGAQRGTSVFTQGSGRNRIRVIVDNRSGNVITVTKG